MRKRHYLLAPLFGLLCAPAGAATTQAFAELDWTTLTVTLSDLTPSDGLLPSFEWTSMTSFVRLQGPYDLANSTSDWLTPLAISGGGASGSVDAATVRSAYAGSLPGLGAAAGAGRLGDFELGGGSAVEISVWAEFAEVPWEGLTTSAYAITFNPVDPSNPAWGSYDQIKGLDASGAFEVSGAGWISLSIANPTAQPVSLIYWADTLVASPVPEPSTQATMLLGAAVVGFAALARCRRSAGFAA